MCDASSLLLTSDLIAEVETVRDHCAHCITQSYFVRDLQALTGKAVNGGCRKGGQHIPWPALLPAAPIGLGRRTAASGSCDRLNLQTLQAPERGHATASGSHTERPRTLLPSWSAGMGQARDPTAQRELEGQIKMACGP
ncbi:hypothetical protein UY3_13738 [Chelonia mydas]|uniref:Uncharacterized protein n=1 Tax=Chelonia mydas TaxID=8469 RepID=M7BAH7_CHEMY|nr:hypothetical protein UY3_13738 [Chelonia mydas]